MISTPQRSSEDVGRYITEHPELAAARWFSFSERLSDQVHYVFIDTYPSETATEQSLKFEACRERAVSDYQVERHDRIKRFLGNDEVACAYFFFWSARNTHQFKKRFGTGFMGSPHLEFCRDVNLRTFDAYEPRAVIANGVSTATSRLVRLYSLKLDEVKCDRTKNSLVKRFSDGKRPWLFVKHLSGSFGYTRDQRRIVQDYVREYVR